MFVNELAPKDITRFIPDYLLVDDLPPQAFFAMESFLKSQGLNQREYLGFITGASEMQETVYKSYKTDRDQLPNDDRATWFSTDKVEDVRVFFRSSKKDPDTTIGSKMRLYSWGQPYGKSDKQVIAHLDSGFLTFGRSYSDMKIVYQMALASTMLFQSLYAIGGPASVRKINFPADKDAVAPSYKMLSSIKASYSADIDRKKINHILAPAAFAAGIENPVEFFGKDNLDAIVNILSQSKSIDEVRDRLADLPSLQLYDDEVSRILDRSNRSDANLSNSGDFSEAPGLNVVATLDEIANIIDSWES